MWRSRSFISRCLSISRMFSSRISYVDNVPIDPELMFMNKTNADIIKLKKQMHALECARNKLHEQIEETMNMMKCLSQTHANLTCSQITPENQEDDVQTDDEVSNLYYCTNAEDEQGHQNSEKKDKGSDVECAEQDEVIGADNAGECQESNELLEPRVMANFRVLDDEELKCELGGAAVIVEDDTLNDNIERELGIKEHEVISKEKVVQCGSGDNDINDSEKNNQESKCELDAAAVAAMISKNIEECKELEAKLKEEDNVPVRLVLFQSKLQTSNETDNDSFMDEVKPQAVLMEMYNNDDENEHHSKSELEASSSTMKQGSDQQRKTVKYKTDDVLETCAKETHDSNPTVMMKQQQAERAIQQTTAVQKKRGGKNDDGPNGPPSGQVTHGGDSASSTECIDDSNLKPQPTLHATLKDMSSQKIDGQEINVQQSPMLPPFKPDIVKFEALDDSNTIYIKHKKPIVVIFEEDPEMPDKAQVLPGKTTENSKIFGTRTDQNSVIYKESVKKNRAGVEYNQIYSSIKPATAQNAKEESLLMVTKYIPNENETETESNTTAVDPSNSNTTNVPKTKTPRIYKKYLSKRVNQVKTVQGEQRELEQKNKRNQNKNKFPISNDDIDNPIVS